MNYFVGSLNGQYEKYEKVKSIVGEYDTLYILGDVLDGENPAESVKIITDLMNQTNIHLILGEHEIAHFYFYYACMQDDRTNIEIWNSYLDTLEPSPHPLVSYLETIGNTKNMIFSFLQMQPVTKLIKIGKMYFYLTHGFPVPPSDNINTFNLDVSSSQILEGEFISHIKADMSLIPDDPEQMKEYDEMMKSIRGDNTLVVCSSQPVEDFGFDFYTEGVVNKNGVILVGSNMDSERIPILAIDSEGYNYSYL